MTTFTPIKLGRGQYQHTLRGGDIAAIASGAKTMYDLQKEGTPRFSWNSTTTVDSRYRELGYLLEALRSKRSSLKHIPEQLTMAIREVIAQRKELFYELPGSYFKGCAAGELDRGDGFWGPDYTASMRSQLEHMYSATAIEHIKTLPECAEFFIPA